MPIKVSQRSRASFWLLLRLVVFVGATYLAVEFFLLRRPKVEGFALVQPAGLGTRFRTPGAKSETRSLKVFGGTLWGVTTERAEGLRWVRADRRKQVVWINEGDGEFFPRAATSVYATEGTNYIDYSVMTPDFGKEWMFKVEHRITRKFQVGPFQFRSGGRQVIYESAIMTNRQRPIP